MFVIRITYQISTASVLNKGKLKVSDDSQAQDLAEHLSALIRAFLVAGRRGAPAEGQLPFNPLYFNILKRLRADGRATPSTLADGFGVPRTTLSTAIKALQSRGLLETEPSQTDGRSIDILLSDLGTEVADAIMRQDHRNAAAMLSALDETERKTFLASFEKITRFVSSE